MYKELINKHLEDIKVIVASSEYSYKMICGIVDDHIYAIQRILDVIEDKE